MKISSVLPGITAGTIVFYCIRPIMDFLGQILIVIYGTISSKYTERFYSEIATGEYNYAFFLTLIVCSAMFWLCVATLYTAFLKKEDNKIVQHIDNDSTISGKIFIIFICFAGALSSIFVSVNGWMAIKITSTFNQHINVLSPYLTDDEHKILISKFASMRNKEDYDNVITSMNAIATNKSVRLPENKMYGL